MFESMNWEAVKASEGEFTQINGAKIATSQTEIRVVHEGQIWRTQAREARAAGKTFLLFELDQNSPIKPAPGRKIAIAVPVGSSTHDAKILSFAGSETDALNAIH